MGSREPPHNPPFLQESSIRGTPGGSWSCGKSPAQPCPDKHGAKQQPPPTSPFPVRSPPCLPAPGRQIDSLAFFFTHQTAGEAERTGSGPPGTAAAARPAGAARRGHLQPAGTPPGLSLSPSPGWDVVTFTQLLGRKSPLLLHIKPCILKSLSAGLLTRSANSEGVNCKLLVLSGHPCNLA